MSDYKPGKPHQRGVMTLKDKRGNCLLSVLYPSRAGRRAELFMEPEQTTVGFCTPDVADEFMNRLCRVIHDRDIKFDSEEKG